MSPWVRIARYGLLPLCALSLLGAHPPPEGVEVSGAAGVGQYSFSSGCGAKGRAIEGIADARVRLRDAKGRTLHVQQTVAPAHVVSSSGDEDRDRVTSGASVVRVGLHGNYVGLELGPTVFWIPDLRAPMIAPSLRSWAGVPQTLYGYSGLMAGVGSGALTLNFLEVGVGRAGERGRFELGGSPLGNVSTRGDLRLGRGSWLGVEAGLGPDRGGNTLTARGLLRFTWSPGDGVSSP